MKYNYILRKILFVLPFVMGLGAFGQNKVSGVIKSGSGEVLFGVNIVEKETVGGSLNGTSSNENGEYSISVGDNAVLVFSYIGFDKVEVVVNGRSEIDVTMYEGELLDEIVITGNRSKPRTILDSPVPIDNISSKELTSGGQQNLETMLTFKVPSFNAQNQAISDATAHYDPADLRGLGPSRTLVLVNGKRKNQSAQVYLNRTPGKGEVGTDLKSIPIAAIDRVEILRDGASAQYGSDAIAGVINMVLKKDIQYSTFSSRAGITSEGDGFNFATDYNTTFGFGEGGFINLTLGYFNQKLTNRAGTPGVDDLPDNPRANEQAWAENNPDLGMHVGLPDLEKTDVFASITHPLGENSEFYTFHGFTHRTGRSFAYYRAPYWRRDVADADFITDSDDFIGYQPTFETLIKDNISSIGVKMDLGSDWKGDVSFTYGGNSVDYTVNNSVNRDYLADKGTSPRTFNPGGYRLNNLIGNIDLSRVFSNVVSTSFGLEYKIENFEAIEGNPLSYYGGGSDSFAGIKPEEAGEWDRNNFAAYLGIDFDISEKFLIGTAGRYEDFSDFGTNFSWKVNGRYKLGDNGAIRSSISTGFRAPTLHQRHLTNSQYIIVAGSSEPLLQGTLANNNAAVEALGVPNLFAETSLNISAGLTYKINRDFSASVDFYQIDVNDRVLFSSQIGSDDNDDNQNPVEVILEENGVVAVQFFINAGDTRTRGADLVFNYRNIDLGVGYLNANLAANFNRTTIDAINTPSALAQNGYEIFAREERGLITNSRPRAKVILGLDFIFDKVDIGFYNTLFGEVTVTAPDSDDFNQGETFDQVLSPKLATDLSFKYKFTDRLSISTIVNNIFDVYPDVTLGSTGTSQAGSRFVYSSEVQQLGQLGRIYNISLNYQF